MKRLRVLALIVSLPPATCLAASDPLLLPRECRTFMVESNKWPAQIQELAAKNAALKAALDTEGMCQNHRDSDAILQRLLDLDNECLASLKSKPGADPADLENFTAIPKELTRLLDQGNAPGGFYATHCVQ